MFLLQLKNKYAGKCFDLGLVVYYLYLFCVHRWTKITKKKQQLCTDFKRSETNKTLLDDYKELAISSFKSRLNYPYLKL